MTPEIKTLPETLLVGMQQRMSITFDQTLPLWQSFMPRLMEIKKLASPDLFSVEVYPDADYFKAFDPNKDFIKWAAASVQEAENCPIGMDRLLIPEGEYAVFPYVGKASKAFETYQYIYEEWIPNSAYKLDDRPHFAIMGANYKGEADDSEEEIWIPVKGK
jgi:AraC family transcriptional regulator